MSYLILSGERYALQIGENTLGGSENDLLSGTPLAAMPVFAVVLVLPNATASIRRLTLDIPIMVDDVPLGDQAVRLRHGSRIETGGQRIVYGDLRDMGSTAHVQGVTDEEAAALAALPLTSPTAPTGGRLVSLRDGAVIPIPDDGLEIGRDPSCGLVLTGRDVSRRHAAIAPSLLGYTITDRSRNGVIVNGARAEERQVLSQNDILRIGGEEYQFLADEAEFAPTRVMLAAEHPTAPRPTSPAAPETPRARSTEPRQPAPTTATPKKQGEQEQMATSLLATLEVLTQGPLKGRRYRIERGLAHIGRAPQNDIQISDSSVSGSHATLMQREGRWRVLDLGSTNGTYVDGERVSGEQELRGPAEIRVGNIKMIFRPIAPVRSGASQTRRIVGVTGEEAEA